MAGKRHHIIPRFLQKGFASRIEDETVSTWQYLRNRDYPKEISTADTIVKEHFYGKGDLNADDLITELEQTKLSPLVNALRDGTCNLNERSRDIAELIAHLSIRSKLVREGFAKMSRGFLDGMKDIFTNEETVDGLISSPPSPFLDETIDAVLDDPQIPELKDARAIFETLGFTNDDVKSMVSGLVHEGLADPETRKESSSHFTRCL